MTLCCQSEESGSVNTKIGSHYLIIRSTPIIWNRGVQVFAGVGMGEFSVLVV